MNKRMILTCVALIVCLYANGQSKWTLKAHEGDVEIYTKNVESSPFKAIRVRCTVPATLSQLVAVILDVNTGAEWVYSTKSSTLLKQVSPSELFYYSEVSLPWPLSNRDFVAHLITSQDPQTKVVTINGPTVADYVPEKKNIVRVQRSYGHWVITPVGKKTVTIDYTLETDPGGSLPAWLVNLFATKGPSETFKKLKLQLQKPAYQDVHLPFIVD
ncbi:lipid-binding protein [Chitinophaga agrisoli]|uniref:Lipid-binding protein n=1 Tax=Chitinophaga agrisoli TaxID=2607653 RepID=A0A5B2VH69_9BACT|nr:START domain-containing protein [Chitinophaga agrisoli]KAA2238923.1 lipid-binding protein [Chitinophaga agrisoli]